MEHVNALETTWAAMCREAGWDAGMNCTPDGRKLARYLATLDRLIGEREAALRAMVAACRGPYRVAAPDSFSGHYVDGIEAAINRAIAEPRQA